MNPKFIFIAFIFIGYKALGQQFKTGTSILNLHFENSMTGYAIVPNIIEIKNRNNESNSIILKNVKIDRLGCCKVEVRNGIYDFIITADGYYPMTSFNVVENQFLNINFNLEPITKPTELRSEFINIDHSIKSMIVVGFLVDKKSGKPIEHVEVSTKDQKCISFSNDKGFYKLIIPLPENKTLQKERGTILFKKGTYRTEIRDNFDMWPNGDMILSIKMLNGYGHNLYSILENREASVIMSDTTVINNKVEGNEYEFNDEFEFKNKLLSPSSVSCASTIRVGHNCSPCVSGCTTVEVVDFETYVKKVLPAEWLNCWGSQSGGMNSLQSGAVAIRTYGLWYIANPISSNYDICDNACCQVYGSTQYTNSNNAVDNTANYILTSSNGNIVKSEYAAEQNNHPSCGNGYKGDGSASWPCSLDQPCTGQTYNGNGRGMCQNGSARWATGLNLTNGTCNFGSSHGYGILTWQQILTHYYPSWTLTTCASCTPPAAPNTTYGGNSCPGAVGTNIYPPGTVLTWNTVSGATGYKVYVSKYPYGNQCLLAGYDPFPCSNLPGQLVMSTALEPGMLYRWNMKATSDCNNPNCDSPFSSTKYFYVPPTILPSTSQTICQGNGVSFSTYTPSVCSGGTLTFQWYKDGSPISGATNALYYATQSGDYYVQLNYSGSTSCNSASVQSASVNVTVNLSPGTASITVRWSNFSAHKTLLNLCQDGKTNESQNGTPEV